MVLNCENEQLKYLYKPVLYVFGMSLVVTFLSRKDFGSFLLVRQSYSYCLTEWSCKEIYQICWFNWFVLKKPLLNDCKITMERDS